MKKRLLAGAPLFALLLIAVPSARAAGEKEKNAGTASFRFVALTDPGETGIRPAKGKFQPVNIGNGFIGAPVRLALTEGPIRLVTPKGADGAADSELCAFAPIGEPRQLVVLVPKGGKTIAHVIPDNATRFPYGRAMLVNLTGSTLAMTVGGTKVVVPPRGSKLGGEIKTKTAAGDVAATVSVLENKTERTLYSTVWPSPVGVRTLVFASGEAGDIAVRVVTDVDTPAMREAPEPKPDKKAPSGKK